MGLTVLGQNTEASPAHGDSPRSRRAAFEANTVLGHECASVGKGEDGEAEWKGKPWQAGNWGRGDGGADPGGAWGGEKLSTRLTRRSSRAAPRE